PRALSRAASSMRLLLTQNEAAKLLHCSLKKVARLRAAGAFPWIPGRPPLIAEEDLTQWLNTTSKTTQARAHLAHLAKMRSSALRGSRETLKDTGSSPTANQTAPAAGAPSVFQRKQRILRRLRKPS